MDPMHELAALIERTAEANGWTQAQIAKRATDHGHTLTVQNLSRIKHEPVKTLVPKTIEALASGLQLPQSVVALAALESMGISVSATPPADATEAVKMDPRLGNRDRRIALAVLSELLAERKDQDNGGSAPKTQAPVSGVHYDAGVGQESLSVEQKADGDD